MDSSNPMDLAALAGADPAGAFGMLLKSTPDEALREIRDAIDEEIKARDEAARPAGKAGHVAH